MGTLKNKLGQSGQTLVEIVVAFGLIAVTMGGLFVLFSNSLSLVLYAQDKTIAYNIAMEGMEIAKQERDQGCSMPQTTGDYVISSDIGGTTNALVLSQPLLQTNAVVGYKNTFKRIITVTTTLPVGLRSQFSSTPTNFDYYGNYFMLTVEVTWKDKHGLDNSTKVSRVMLREWKNI